MRVEKITVNKTGVLSKVIANELSYISYNLIRKIIRKKDIKVNGVRVSKDVVVNEGDCVCVYINEQSLNFYDLFFEDENVIVVNKKRYIEVISDEGCNIVELLKKDLNCNEIYAVHRLDRNTQGLVIFAKNIDAKKALDKGFKNRTFEKYYLTEVYGYFDKKQESLSAYLKKDPVNSFVLVSDLKIDKEYELIKTNYKVVQQRDGSAVLEVELITGKTHQIRAHLAHIGHFILGDEKYGDNKINKKLGIKYQNLIAYKLILHFSNDSCLSYLDNKIFEIDKNNIDFIKI